MDLSLYSDMVSGHIARRPDLKLTDSMFCLCVFFYIFDGSSIVKLTGSMFFSLIFSSTFSIEDRL